MPKVVGRTILSSDAGTPTRAPSVDPQTPTGPFSDDEERTADGRQTPLPSLEAYLRGGVGLGLVSAPYSPFRPLQAHGDDSLPGSSPIPTSPVRPLSFESSGSEDSGSESSDNEDKTPVTPALPPLSSDGLLYTSPIAGTKEQKLAKIRAKAAKKRLATIANKQTAAEAASEEENVAIFEEILEKLSSNRLSFGQLMLYVFDPLHRGLATQILNLWVSNKNSATVRQEVGTWAEDYVVEQMRDEAEGITASKQLQTADTAIDNKYVTGFSMLSMGTYIQTEARVSMKMLGAFATSSRNLKTGLAQRTGKRFTIITAAALSLLGEFSHKNNFSRRLYLYATGAQRQTISVMSHLGISESYQHITRKARIMINRRRRVVDVDAEPPAVPPCTPMKVHERKIEALKKPVKPGTLEELSASMRGFARGVASTGLFAASYDNINLVFRAAEQVMGRTDSQENGTCATIFPLWKAAAEHMRISDLDTAFNAAPPLSIDDILLTAAETKLMDKCLRHCILRIIVEHGGEHFKRFCDDVQNALPVTADKIELHQTPLHPLPAWNIDQSTIIGNAEVADTIYSELEAKGLSHWNWIVKILCGDQLTIARLRSLLNIRAGHEGGVSGFGWGVWMPGLFHGKIADMHGFFKSWLAFLPQHRASSVSHPLTSFPPFRVCRDLVFVSLNARVLHCLLLVSGKTSLAECADSITSFAQLETYAGLIQTKYANAELVSKLRWERQTTQAAEGLLPPGDQIFENASLLLRDALISREFTDSIKAGDSGRIVLVLKLLALSFRGNRRSKYAHEMLHLIHNLTHVWPKPIRNIVLNNWLVNPTGNPFSWVEVDLMQEHMNFWIKAHGCAASWEWLGMVAPCVTALRHLSTSIINILGSEQGTKHAPADLATDIDLLMRSMAEHDVYQVKGRVFAEGDGSPTPDVITIGIQQITDSTSNPLTEYNTAFLKLQARRHLRPLVSNWSDMPASESTAGDTLPPSSRPLPSPAPPSHLPTLPHDAYGRDTNCQLVNACVVILFCIVLLETLAWIDWYPADVGKCHQSMRGTPDSLLGKLLAGRRNRREFPSMTAILRSWNLRAAGLVRLRSKDKMRVMEMGVRWMIIRGGWQTLPKEGPNRAK
ncbi:hypothetical protein B0H14DRAFT_3596127 [Mycena olivaceomarginata]|nr:hypothetical protein B0H14DRAFT_3596127 [Mycena olivaceomarginata]